jgi:hypothetical protein
MFELGELRVILTLYTDAYVVRGTALTRQRRVSDVLNFAEHDFIVLADVVMDEFGSRAQTLRAEFAQVNLAAVLFAVVDTTIEPVPELRTPKIPELAIISVPVQRPQDPPPAGARPPRGAQRAHRPLPPGHRCRVLVGHRR